MAVTGFAHYNLKAPLELLEQLKAFYCDVVGLKAGPRPPFERFGYWLYLGEQSILHLIVPESGQNPATHVLTTMDHVAFYSTEYDLMQHRLEQHQIQYRASSVPLTGEKQLFFYDPAGNGVELNFVATEAAA